MTGDQRMEQCDLAQPGEDAKHLPRRAGAVAPRVPGKQRGGELAGTPAAVGRATRHAVGFETRMDGAGIVGAEVSTWLTRRLVEAELRAAIEGKRHAA